MKLNVVYHNGQERKLDDLPKLRPATTADIPEMTRIAALAYEDALAHLEGLPDLVNIAGEELQCDTAYVAECEGKLAGLLIAIESDDAMKLANLAVDPAFQGHGIARLLLRNIEDIARGRGKHRLELVSHSGMTATLAMYKYLGWQEYDHRGVAVLMSKQL